RCCSRDHEASRARSRRGARGRRRAGRTRSDRPAQARGRGGGRVTGFSHRAMKIIVGLGNPGARYVGTRHNVGFAVLDWLAQAPGTSRPLGRFNADIRERLEEETKVLLVKPQSFMNLSGRSVREILDFYQVPTEELLVICDDFNLPLGKLRIRSKGSEG